MKKSLFVWGTLALLLPLLTAAHAEETNPDGWGMMGLGMDGVGMYGFMGWSMFLLSLVWLIVGILAIVWLWQRIDKK